MPALPPSAASANHNELEAFLLSDFPALQVLERQIQQRQQSGQVCDLLLGKLLQQLQASCAKVALRKNALPVITFPDNLPIAAKREEICALIAAHQVIVLAGETGSGKTTQIPKMCLSLGRGLRGMIGHTQPRRLAARTVASRIADELGVALGSSVGYQVRFTDVSQDNTHIKLMTDGILLAEIQSDPLLWRYDTLIIDEAHERSLNIDFILGYLKQLLPKRPDLKIIITSATIDLQRFSQHFDGAPIIEVSGRTYPVEVWYRPPSEQDDQVQAIIAATQEILALPQKSGDILVFLSGEREIRETANESRKANFPHLEVLPLYARLSNQEQNRVFAGAKGRRIILATNVAETSITVPGIGYVIDPGTARISRYSHRTKVQRLPIEAIAQASANQRKGRCGRVASGICVRLYTEEDFNNRPVFTDAEILRTNLAAVILQMVNLGVGDIRQFPFVDPPDSRLISDGFKLLEELQAATPAGQLTPLGKTLARLPVDPRLGRMLIEANQRNCLTEMLIITTALSMQDPRERPAEKQQASDEKHRRFWHEQSDFLAWVNLWQYAENQRQELTQNQWRRLCEKDYLNYLRMREWRELHHQLRLACKELAFKENHEAAGYEALHRSLLTGLLGNIGCKSEESSEHEYLGARNRRFALFPASSQYKKKPKWIMAATLLETSKLYAHTLAKIEPEWIVETARDLVKHHYYEPHYAYKTGQILAYDRVSLYGLILKEKQTVNFAHIDAVVSREVFIRQALVEGAYGKNAPAKIGEFFRFNQRQILEVQELEAKSRRKDIMVDDEVQYQFYAERLPSKIPNLAAFEHWRKRTEQQDARLLFMPRDILMRHEAGAITEAQFPKYLAVDGMELPLVYHFAPGAQDDGVSIQVPISILHNFPEARLQWLVPGLLRDKCIAILKCLPKNLRKSFVPIPNTVDKFLARLSPSNRPLCDAMGDELQRLLGGKLPTDTWHAVDLESFYQMNIQVMDERNKMLAQSRDLSALRSQYRADVQQSLQQAGNHLEKTDLIDWNFGELEAVCVLNKGNLRMRGYPSLIDKGDSVELKVLDNPQESAWYTRKATARLLLLNLADAVKYLRKNLLKNSVMGLTQVALGSQSQVVDDILIAAVKTACLDGRAAPKNRAEFLACLEAGRGKFLSSATAYEQLLVESLQLCVAIKNAMKNNKNALLLFGAMQDIQQQLQELFYPGFLQDCEWEQVRHLPRYLNAIDYRMQKASQNLTKDKQAQREVEVFLGLHRDHLAKEGPTAFRLQGLWQEYRWLIEELRVSLFAQQLKTPVPVSPKRLEKAWSAVLASE